MILVTHICTHNGWECSGGVEPRDNPHTHQPWGWLCQSHFGERLQSLTCNDCTDNKTCEFAFDDYNTYGDCLAVK